MNKATVFALDVVVVVIFTMIGRLSHGEALSLGGWATTLWPFLAGTVVGWAILLGLRLKPAGLRAGAAVWVATVAIGMVLRVVAGQGTAVSFIIVATVFVGLFVMGWRLIAAAVVKRARRTSRAGA